MERLGTIFVIDLLRMSQRLAFYRLCLLFVVLRKMPVLGRVGALHPGMARCKQTITDPLDVATDMLRGDPFA